MNFPVRLKHPDHGFMHVYNKDELENHKKIGWEMEAVVEPEEVKKRGRPKKVEA